MRSACALVFVSLVARADVSTPPPRRKQRDLSACSQALKRAQTGFEAESGSSGYLSVGNEVLFYDGHYRYAGIRVLFIFGEPAEARHAWRRVLPMWRGSILSRAEPRGLAEILNADADAPSADIVSKWFVPALDRCLEIAANPIGAALFLT
jgi:hypothetical protein